MRALLDTGVLYALVDRSDRWHEASVQSLSSYREALLLPAPVITEACFLIARAGGAAATARFLRSLADSTWQVQTLAMEDYARASAIREQDADSRIDGRRNHPIDS